MDTTNFLETLIGFFKNKGVRFCVIGGQAVNAYVEPLVSLDLDLAIAVDSLEELEKSLAQKFNVRRLPHRLNVSLPGSDLRVQIQTDERHQSIVNRASEMNVLGMNLPVASLEDILQGKIWAILDPDRRGSQRQKDLADIARILESFPHLRDKVPAEILKRLEI